MARMAKRQQEEKFAFKQPDPVVVRKKDQTSERAKELQDAFAQGFNSVAEKRAADENQRILDIIRQRNEAEQEAALLPSPVTTLSLRVKKSFSFPIPPLL